MMTTTQHPTPYLSAVMFTRNDGYGGRRHEIGLLGLLRQAEKHRLRLEVVIVEWNPPPDRPRFKEAFPWPKDLTWSTVRIISVPPELHQRYEYWERYPIHGVVSFNAGFRRARGEFVLSTTPDMLFSDELMTFLASEQLDKDNQYGINIHHVSQDVLRYPTVEQQLGWCKNHVRKVSEIGHINALSPDDLELHREGPGDFILFSRERWHRLRGYPEIDIVGGNTGDLIVHMAYLSGAADVKLREPLRVYHMDHETKRGNIRFAVRFVNRACERLHCPAPLATVIKAPAYRLFPPKDTMAERGLTTLTGAECRSIIFDMVKGKRSYIYNDEDWGLGQETLEETTITTADWDKAHEKIG